MPPTRHLGGAAEVPGGFAAGCLTSRIVSQVQQSVAATPVTDSPFAHLAVDNALPPDVFSRLAADVPSFDALLPMSQTGWSSVARYDKRATLPFADLSNRSDPEVWQVIADALLSPEVELVLRQAFQPWLSGAVHEELAHPLRKEVRAHCDLAGSYMTPHTDAPSMFITSFVYVRSGAPDSSLDTVLYEPIDPAARAHALSGREYGHEDPAWHREVGRVAFRPNRLFSFLRTDSSVHSIGPVSVAAAPRHLISLHLKYAKRVEAARG